MKSAARVTRTLAVLSEADVNLLPGLSAARLDHIEESLGFELHSDHRELRSRHVPHGQRWPHWEWNDDPRVIANATGPGGDLLHNVRQGTFWMTDWGVRPANPDAAVAVARSQLEPWPKIVRLYGHRYIATASSPDSVVLSCMFDDVIVYGADLLEWAINEFEPEKFSRRPASLGPWTTLG